MVRIQAILTLLVFNQGYQAEHLNSLNKEQLLDLFVEHYDASKLTEKFNELLKVDTIL